MAHPYSSLSPAHLAATAAKLCKENQCDTRAFDDCFESGREEEVVAAFMTLYHRDAQLQLAVLRNESSIRIDQWQATADRVAQQQSAPLFARQ